MKTRICTATGKRQYTRHQDAQKVIGRATKQSLGGLIRKPKTTYQCTACGKWHLTGMEPKDARQLRRRV